MTTPNPNFSSPTPGPGQGGPGASSPVPGGQGGAPGAPVSKTKWIVQLVVGTLCFGNLVTMILAIIGLVKADQDLPLANKLYKWGWIIYAIWAVLTIIGLIVYFTVVVPALINSGSMQTY
ncbi:hypothetical protein DEO23_03270 [Brachybacterium endophyticum]|uniref:Cardiolipin synthase N-terminal domain-containing protein n=1 Tax=Brachybacterium endophyticum TaxID=2182385 RepID=A0A2U2RP38_9MICO|nr:hypothetical protein [Brachybacterium endophyticum]PWH07658.1 hypothetical protein DEO23_03270 [Brachybacterium endophyticum]